MEHVCTKGVTLYRQKWWVIPERGHTGGLAIPFGVVTWRWDEHLNVPFREVCSRAKLFDTGRALRYRKHALRLVKEYEGLCDRPAVI